MASLKHRVVFQIFQVLRGNLADCIRIPGIDSRLHLGRSLHADHHRIIFLHSTFTKCISGDRWIHSASYKDTSIVVAFVILQPLNSQEGIVLDHGISPVPDTNRRIVGLVGLTVLYRDIFMVDLLVCRIYRVCVASHCHAHIGKDTIVDLHRVTCRAIMVGPLIIKSVVIRIRGINIDGLFVALIVIDPEIRKRTILNIDILG